MKRDIFSQINLENESYRFSELQNRETLLNYNFALKDTLIKVINRSELGKIEIPNEPTIRNEILFLLERYNSFNSKTFDFIKLYAYITCFYYGFKHEPIQLRENNYSLIAETEKEFLKGYFSPDAIAWNYNTTRNWVLLDKRKRKVYEDLQVKIMQLSQKDGTNKPYNTKLDARYINEIELIDKIVHSLIYIRLQGKALISDYQTMKDSIQKELTF